MTGVLTLCLLLMSETAYEAHSAVIACNGQANLRAIVFILHPTRPGSADHLKQETLTAVENLKPSQPFNIVGTDCKGRLAVCWKGGLVDASPENKKIALHFIAEMGLSTHDTLLSMIEPAFLLGPDLAYIITDAVHLDPALIDRVSESARGLRVKVNAILVDQHARQSEQVLMQTAERNRGRYRFLGEDDTPR